MSFSSLMTDVGVENLALMALEMLAAELQALRQLFNMLLLFENSSNRDISFCCFSSRMSSSFLFSGVKTKLWILSFIA